MGTLRHRPHASNVAVVPLLRNKNGGGTLIFLIKNKKNKKKSAQLRTQLDLWDPWRGLSSDWVLACIRRHIKLTQAEWGGPGKASFQPLVRVCLQTKYLENGIGSRDLEFAVKPLNVTRMQHETFWLRSVQQFTVF
jgi:hypothetical protein